MDVLKMLQQMRAERDCLDEAIMTLERLAGGHGRRRGRPPKWKARLNTGGADVARRKRKPFSAATRAKMAASQKRRWAAVRAAA